MNKMIIYWFAGLCVLMMTQGVWAGDGSRYRIFASGAQEVSPPAPEGGVVTDTTARLDLQFNRLLSEATFRLNVNDGFGINQAHLHCGGAGSNGPVVAFLFGLDPNGVDVDGILSSGELTNLDIIDNACIDAIGQPVNNIASLAAAIKNGLIYLNVHALSNPPGLVRGQFLPQ